MPLRGSGSSATSVSSTRTALSEVKVSEGDPIQSVDSWPTRGSPAPSRSSGTAWTGVSAARASLQTMARRPGSRSETHTIAAPDPSVDRLTAPLPSTHTRACRSPSRLRLRAT